jgi:hypothetical protein
MHDLAQAWVADEPQDHRANDALVQSYIKLGDVHMLAGDVVQSRHDYGEAIAICRGSAAAEPDDEENKSNLQAAFTNLASLEVEQHERARAKVLFNVTETARGCGHLNGL